MLLLLAGLLCAEPAPAQIAATPAQTEPVAQSLDNPEESRPALSVMIVETVRRPVSLVNDPALAMEFMPVKVRVRTVDHLSGRTYPRHSDMYYMAGAFHRGTGIRYLVIAEPHQQERGFLARWFTTERNGEYCVPSETVDAVRVRQAFMSARLERRDRHEFLCLSG